MAQEHPVDTAEIGQKNSASKIQLTQAVDAVVPAPETSAFSQSSSQPSLPAAKAPMGTVAQSSDLLTYIRKFTPIGALRVNQDFNAYVRSTESGEKKEFEVKRKQTTPSSLLSRGLEDPAFAQGLLRSKDKSSLDEEQILILSLRLGPLVSHPFSGEKLMSSVLKANHETVALNLCESALAAKLSKAQLLAIVEKFPAAGQYILQNSKIAVYLTDNNFVKEIAIALRDPLILKTLLEIDRTGSIKWQESDFLRVHEWCKRPEEEKSVPRRDAIFFIQDFLLNYISRDPNIISQKTLCTLAAQNEESAGILLKSVYDGEKKAKHELSSSEFDRIVQAHPSAEFYLTVLQIPALTNRLNMSACKRMVSDILRSRATISDVQYRFINVMLCHPSYSNLFDKKLLWRMVDSGMGREVFSAAKLHRSIDRHFDKKDWLELAKEFNERNPGIGIDIVTSKMAETFKSADFLAIARSNPSTRQIIGIKHVEKLTRSDLNELVPLLSKELLSKLLKDQQIAKKINPEYRTSEYLQQPTESTGKHFGHRSELNSDRAYSKNHGQTFFGADSKGKEADRERIKKIKAELAEQELAEQQKEKLLQQPPALHSSSHPQ